MASAGTESFSGQLQVGPSLFVQIEEIANLREQDVNAHTMSPKTFDRLVENIKMRGAMESLAYCAQPGGDGPVEIVSGHHRVRAAKEAGLKEIPILLDVSRLTRSTIIAKQLAHNALVGTDDPDILRQLIATIDTPDDLLATGLPEEYLNKEEDRDVLSLFTPRVDFGYRTVTFAFLPHQQGEIEKLIDLLEGRQDLVVAAPQEQFDELLKAAARYARIKKVKSGATAISLMVRLALEELNALEEETPEAD